MARFTLTNEFTALTGLTDGTLQNVSRSVPVEVATSTTKNTGILLYPGDKIQYKSENAMYARAAWENPAPTETVYLAHEPFNGAGEGGDSSRGDRKPGTMYAVNDIAYTAELPTGKALVCVSSGTTGAGTLTLSSTDEGALTTDGTVTWMVVIDVHTNGSGRIIYPGVGYQRRARKAFTLADMIAAVDSGNYNEYDIEPGDFFTGTSDIPISLQEIIC